MEHIVKHVLEHKVFVRVWLEEILARHVLEHQVFLGWSAEPADRGVDSSGMDRLSGTADLSSGRSRDQQLGTGSAVFFSGPPGLLIWRAADREIENSGLDRPSFSQDFRPVK